MLGDDEISQLIKKKGYGKSNKIALLLIPLILSGEIDEVSCYLPEVIEKAIKYSEKIGGVKSKLEAIWKFAKNIESQKEFALFVNKYSNYSGLLFEARKKKIEFNEIWKEKAEQYLIRNLS